MFIYSSIKIIMLTIHTRKLLIDYRGLQFRLDVTRIRGFSPGTVHLERATQTCYLFSASQRNLRRAVCLNPPLLNRVSWNPLRIHGIRDVQTEVQSAVTMDRARPSCSAATTVTVATETCRLFFLLATEESLERVLTLCRFVAMLLASQSLEHIGHARL